MKSINFKKHLIALLVCIAYISANAQGVVVYKKDGTKIKVPYEQLDSISTYNYDDEPGISGDLSDERAVDLGLSVKWATMNIGANNPEDYGDYFQWGETSTKNKYTQGNYTYSANPTTLPLENDAAHAKWGGNWRMPTLTEFMELRKECIWTWTTMNGKKGYKATGPNGNSIFLPAAGYRWDSNLEDANSVGHYWSSSLYPSDTSCAYSLKLESGISNPSQLAGRYIAYTVRPVCP